MAWTAPKTWSVGEVATAANFNTHIRDNLSYLKGLAGQVTVEDQLKVLSANSTGVLIQRTVANNPSLTFCYDGPDVNNAGYAGFGVDSSGGVTGYGSGGMFVSAGAGGTGTARPLILHNYSNQPIVFAQNNAERGRIDATGLGLGTTSPQGKLHGYDAISGFLHWKYDGVDGTARTVIPDGAGDVQYILGVLCVGRTSGGTAFVTHYFGAASLTPGANQSLYTAGSDVLQIQVSAAGAVTVQRTGGTLTYKVALWCMWI